MQVIQRVFSRVPAVLLQELDVYNFGDWYLKAPVLLDAPIKGGRASCPHNWRVTFEPGSFSVEHAMVFAMRHLRAVCEECGATAYSQQEYVELTRWVGGSSESPVVHTLRSRKDGVCWVMELSYQGEGYDGPYTPGELDSEPVDEKVYRFFLWREHPEGLELAISICTNIPCTAAVDLMSVDPTAVLDTGRLQISVNGSVADWGPFGTGVLTESVSEDEPLIGLRRADVSAVP